VSNEALKRLMGPSDRATVEFAESVERAFNRAFERIAQLETRVRDLEQAATTGEAEQATRERGG
jgi:hypothetical protein